MKYTGFGAALGLTCLLGILPSVAQADGCYLCSGGGYVQFAGDDTFEKRQKAKSDFGCEVSGTTSSCSNPKGQVSWLRDTANATVACDDEKGKKGEEDDKPKG